MGAWGVKNFDNDTSLDFKDEVFIKGKKHILHKIKFIVDYPKNNLPDSKDCEEALAAIEFVAAAKDRPSSDFPEDAFQWIIDQDILDFDTFLQKFFMRTSIDVISLSVSAIDRIKNNSELNDLWKETDEYNNWLSVLDDLKNRLQVFIK